MSENKRVPTVLISYSHKDAGWKDRLAIHLRVLAKQGEFSVWTDDQIGVGEDWQQRLQDAISAASVAILLVSANSLTSDFILREEVSRLLIRRHTEGLVIIPVVISPCLWNAIPWLTQMQMMPRNPHRPLSARRRWEVDAALAEITEHVMHALHQRRLTYNTRSERYPVYSSGSAAANSAASEKPLREAWHEKGGSQMSLVYVWGGRFDLGDGHFVTVNLSPFWISKYPVTNAQYADFLSANPEHRLPAFWHKTAFNKPQQPVVGVSWQDAEDYCAWFGLSLPAEAQWEAAAAGPRKYTFPWGDSVPTASFANFGLAIGRTTPVGTYPSGVGPYGTHDQAGNVQEWCLDVYKPNVEETWEVIGKDPIITTGQDSTMRVLRGGSWATDQPYLRNSARRWDWAGNRYDDVGFRCVLNNRVQERQS